MALVIGGSASARVWAAPAPASKAPVATAVETKAANPKIPVEAFANLPFVDGAELSPDGTHVAGLFNISGEQRIVMYPLFGDKAGGVVVGVPDGTNVAAVRWVNDDNIIVTLTGLLPVEDERWYISRMIAVNRVTKKLTKILWDLNGQNTADVLWIPSDNSNEILVAAQSTIYSNFPGFWPSVYRVDVTNGKRKVEVTGRDGFLEWGADHLGNVRMGIGYNDQKRTSRLTYRPDGKSLFKTVDRVDHRQNENLNVPFLFLAGGDNGLVLRDNDAGNSSIYETNLVTQATVRTVFEPKIGEARSVITSHDGSTLLGVTTTDQDHPVVWLDPKLAELQSNFQKSVPNKRVMIQSMNQDQTKMLVRIDSANNPGTLYFFSTTGGVLQKIAAINQDIAGKHLSPVKLVQYKARDGLQIEGVLTMPVGRAEKNLPFIVLPHGGPWAHDGLEYDYWAQFLASRGYGVLQPNFRGSTGYGTPFIDKGKGQMGFAMQDDVSDGVKWAVAQGIADPKRVCIVGASYGGYAAMWGIEKDPDLYRCAISIAGVSALRREVNDFGDSVRGNLYKDQWKEMTPDFNAVSPINAIDRIKAPLLLIHGKKDVTVDHIQSVKMNNAMTKAGKTVEFVSIPRADHYFVREADRLTLLKAMETFLQKYNPAD